MSRCRSSIRSPPDACRRLSLTQQVAAFFVGPAMNDETDRRRQSGRERQARYRAKHHGETRALQLPAPLHAAIRHRARTAGLSVPKFLQLLTGTRS